jgi:phage FluMu protein gp41
MVNQTANSQRFPGLDIVFSNQNQQPITKRTITPKEYLQSPLDSESLIKTNEKIHISIQVPNPGNAATNASVQISNSD